MILLSDKNVSHEAFDKAYMYATSVFNGFFGVLMREANDAVLEAVDAYEGTREWRFNVKRAFKRCASAWDARWMLVKEIFGDRWGVYIDFVNQQCRDLEEDNKKLYLCVHSSLLRQGVEDANRKAWVYAADLLTHELCSVYDRFLKALLDETGMPRLIDTFAWAKMTHLRTLAHDMVRAVATCDVELDDNVVLALRIIEQKAVSADKQDAAAVRAMELIGNEGHRDAMADSIAAFHEHMAEKEQAEREANENYWRQKEEERERRSHGNRETLTAEAMAEQLGTKFKVIHNS